MNDVYRVAADGGTPMAVSGDRYANEFFSAPSPDGTTLAMSARGNGVGAVVAARAQPSRRGEIWLRDLTAADAPSAYARAHERRRQGPVADVERPTASRSSSCPIAAAPRTSGSWRPPPDRAPRQVTRFTDGRVLWPSITATARRSCSSATSGSGQLDTASGKAREVPITRCGAPAGPAVEHLRLTNQFQDLALSPDGKKIAFVAHGEIFAASAKDGGDAARVTTTAGARVAGRCGRPTAGSCVYSSDARISRQRLLSSTTSPPARKRR